LNFNHGGLNRGAAMKMNATLDFIVLVILTAALIAIALAL
jgi:hypothetical protein